MKKEIKVYCINGGTGILKGVKNIYIEGKLERAEIVQVSDTIFYDTREIPMRLLRKDKRK